MYLVCVVGFNNQSVQMRVNIIFATNILVDQEILALVAKDDMHFLSSWSTDVRSCTEINITVEFIYINYIYNISFFYNYFQIILIFPFLLYAYFMNF